MKMKLLRIAFPLLALLVATSAFADPNAQAAFEKLKALQGNWSGTTSEGKTLQVTFRVVSGGSAVESEIHGESEADMISVFHLDGDRLLMTHYCGTGNQPRMVGTLSPDGKTIRFNFLDATNLLPSQPGHMEHMTLTLPDANRQTEQWDFLARDGQHQQHEIFELQRSK
jgi:hypothetical protein